MYEANNILPSILNFYVTAAFLAIDVTRLYYLKYHIHIWTSYERNKKSCRSILFVKKHI